MKENLQSFSLVLTRTLVVVGVLCSGAAVRGGDACGDACGDHAATAAKTVALRPLGEFRGIIAESRRGTPVALPTGEARTVNGSVYLRQDSHGCVTVGGALDGQGNGSFFLTQDGDKVFGAAYWTDRPVAYRYTSRDDGTLVAEEVSVHEILCIGLPRHGGNAEARPPPAPDAPIAAVPSLQSRPQATAVVYLDMDGQTVSDPYWNNGRTINAPDPNLSAAEVRAIWERVTEDFLPFHLNVTTDEAVYLSAPQNRRIRCIITTDGSWYGNAGGVALLNSFTWTGDTPCWVFMADEKPAAEAATHEVGHTFGLRHDGDATQEYYPGHGNGETGWAPIMGVGYYQNLVQWSKGEYQGANNQENDLATIAGFNHGFGYRDDDYGNDWPSAAVLPSGPFSVSGVIERGNDVDAFLFSVSSGDVTVTIEPAPRAPNLDILAEIRDHSGALIASSNPADALAASFSETIPYGTYVLLISGTGKGNPLGTGYTDYGSLGEYTVSGTIVGGAVEQTFPIDENPAMGQLIGRVDTDGPPGGLRAFSIRNGVFSDAFSIDNAGDLSVADPSVFDYEARTNIDIVVYVNNISAPALSRDYFVRAAIQDVDEVPVFTGTPYAWYVRETAASGSVVGAVHAVDPEQGAVSYAIVGGNQDGFFSIDAGTGDVRSMGMPGMTAVQDTPIVLQVSAVDGGGPSNMVNTAVTIEIVASVLDTPSALTYYIASNRAPRGAWTEKHFDDSAWTKGVGGIGYDMGSTYDPYVVTDVEASMRNQASTLYARLPFAIVDVPNVRTAYLGIRYDDGFVAYLNGREIARRNTPVDDRWDAVATTNRPSAEATAPEYVAIPSPDYLADGINILAIHGLNDGASGADFLIEPVVMVTLQDQPTVRPPSIVSQRTTNATAHTVDYHAMVTAGGELPDLTLYWGTRDAGVDTNAWQNSAGIGTQAGDVLNTITGLMQVARYYARIHAANSAGMVWAADSVVFTTEYERTEYVLPGAVADYWIPQGSGSDATWMLPEFTATQTWSRGHNGIGYERDTGYEEYVFTDVSSGMYGANATVYVRIPFHIGEVQDIKSMALEMQYDDAFVAYLNGEEIARGGAVDDYLVWNTAARADRPDLQAVVFESHDVTPFADNLVVGNNVLAIHGMNRLTADSDMLISARLTSALHFRAPTYEQWLIAETTLPEAFSGPYDDPDGDRWFNLLEYAFGGNPTTPDHARVAPSLWGDVGYVDLKYRRRVNYMEAGIDYGIWTTPGVMPSVWAPAVGQPIGSVPDADGITEVVTVRFNNLDAERYYRLSASVPTMD